MKTTLCFNLLLKQEVEVGSDQTCNLKKKKKKTKGAKLAMLSEWKGWHTISQHLPIIGIGEIMYVEGGRERFPLKEKKTWRNVNKIPQIILSSYMKAHFKKGNIQNII